MTVLLVASDQPGAGKTSVATSLANDLTKRDKRVALGNLQPVSRMTGEDPASEAFRELLGQAPLDLPAVPDGGGLTADFVGRVADAARSAQEGRDLLLIEVSSELSPGLDTDLAEALDARVLAVAGYGPGLDAASLASWRDRHGDRLVGVLINGLTRYQRTTFQAGLLPALKSRGVAPLGVIPEDRSLLAVSVHQLTSHLDGRFVVGEEFADGVVEHLLVGGLGLDSGELYFNLYDKKAVIVRGDRPDIQMAALQTPTSCMVLTRGIEPIEYVSYEAELEEVPIIVVEHDTLLSMNALANLPDKARFDHPAKLARYTELLREHADVSAIYAGLGLAM